ELIYESSNHTSAGQPMSKGTVLKHPRFHKTRRSDPLPPSPQRGVPSAHEGCSEVHTRNFCLGSSTSNRNHLFCALRKHEGKRSVRAAVCWVLTWHTRPQRWQAVPRLPA
ncbi:unnamed protein product, partial [Ectocarpus sp. 4 AP-2014]